MASNIKVVDINEADKQEANEAVETIPEEAIIENVVEPTEGVANESIPVVQSTRAGLLDNPPEPKPELKKKESPIALEQTQKTNVRQQDKLVKCPKCEKQMKLKSYRYKHELSCKGKLEDIPKKPKAMPKPKARPIVQEVEQREALPSGNPKLTQPIQNQILKPQPRNPLNEKTNHYHLLHQQYIQQKKEKYDALCKNMFSTKSKKR